MGISKISWCDWTWNPVTGCTPVGRGCENCWAKAMAPRIEGTFEVTCHEERLEEPYRWKKPRRVFVVPRGDLFHPSVPFEFQKKVLDVIVECRTHIFYILTKRPANMDMVLNDYLATMHPATWDRYGGNERKVFEHVWWGISVEDDKAWRDRMPSFISQWDINRFISFEPLLEEIDLIPETWLEYIGWIIVGGESGIGYRAMKLAWVREIREVCLERKIPFFFKQRADRFPEQGKELDGRKWEQYPFEW